MATNKNTILLFTFAILLLIAAGSLHTNIHKPKIEVSKQNSALNFNNDLMTIFSIGQKRLLTDILWITTLLESDLEHYKGKDLNSWMYLRFKSILSLDPKFLGAYRFGGKYLSIVKDDLLGASEIFEAGLKVYPNDYDLLYDAAFLYTFEIQDFKRGADLYKKVIKFKKAPEFVKSILSKINFEVHKDLKLTFKIVKKIYDDEPEGSHLKNRLQSDLYSIRAEIDLDCLNSKKPDCSKIDFLGNPYIYSNGKFQSQLPFKPYRFNKKPSNQSEN